MNTAYENVHDAIARDAEAFRVRASTVAHPLPLRQERSLEVTPNVVEQGQKRPPLT